uniref:AB hydrolase-1 domain-containing protein n=1 Tax=Bionectria ochroleuca TaxID=29856 RepID=A0A8H7NH02_BIOOC
MSFHSLIRPRVAHPAIAAARRSYASVQVVSPLAYDLHEPAKPRTDKQNEPILFLHGLFGSKKNNRAISKALARDLGRYVYALDLRNHGESPHDKRHDYTAMAEDVAHFIRENGLKESSIIGHSMGAKTAMTLALGSPDLVANIASVDNAPSDKSLGKGFADYVRGMKQIDASNCKRQAEADEILKQYEESITIRQFLLGNLYRPQARTSPSSASRWTCSAAPSTTWATSPTRTRTRSASGSPRSSSVEPRASTSRTTSCL